MDKKIKDAAIAANKILQEIASNKAGFLLMVVDDSQCTEDNLFSECSTYLKIHGSQLALAKGLAGAAHTDNFIELASTADVLINRVECEIVKKSVGSED